MADNTGQKQGHGGRGSNFLEATTRAGGRLDARHCQHPRYGLFCWQRHGFQSHQGLGEFKLKLSVRLVVFLNLALCFSANTFEIRAAEFVLSESKFCQVRMNVNPGDKMTMGMVG